MLRSINPSFPGLFSTKRKVVYVFRTRLPVAINCIATVLLPLDLHVLSLPLAFILSQDQTLHCKRVMTLALKILLENLTVLVFNNNVAKTYPRYLKYQSAVASKLSKIFSALLAVPIFQSGCKGKRPFYFSKIFLDFKKRNF